LPRSRPGASIRWKEGPSSSPTRRTRYYPDARSSLGPPRRATARRYRFDRQAEPRSRLPGRGEPSEPRVPKLAPQLDGAALRIEHLVDLDEVIREAQLAAAPQSIEEVGLLCQVDDAGVEPSHPRVAHACVAHRRRL